MGKGKRPSNFTSRITNAEGKKVANGQVRTDWKRTIGRSEIVDTNNLLICPGIRQFVDIDKGAILQGYAQRSAYGLTSKIRTLWLLSKEPAILSDEFEDEEVEST